MKRKLTTEEEKLTISGKEMNEDQLERLKISLEYNKDVMDLNNHKRAHELKWAKYLIQEKEREEKGILDMIKKEIDDRLEKIKIANQHLNTGVEVKENKIAG